VQDKAQVLADVRSYIAEELGIDLEKVFAQFAWASQRSWVA
jgi:hypothetical protein